MGIVVVVKLFSNCGFYSVVGCVWVFGGIGSGWVLVGWIMLFFVCSVCVMVFVLKWFECIWVSRMLVFFIVFVIGINMFGSVVFYLVVLVNGLMNRVELGSWRWMFV